ncbi:MAG: hypothetical protein WDM79_04190 [Terricaulis sp.]
MRSSRQAISANDARADEYGVLAGLLNDAPAPLFLLPGNHDDPALMRAAFPAHGYFPREGPLSYAIDEFPVRLVAIDQIVFGETHGDFTPEHARWLEERARRRAGQAHDHRAPPSAVSHP